ncbi:hypothetical protein LP52_01385 [Streptomonospora alba]|uniref:Peptidase S8/S53 domain-containing protein n=1 Tax=Streptomonospora alba TaxID=183763 RepID=A0A0C2GAR9_9ACTN|nr:S8 family serine peptidase [Streptomonospora alba]KII00499.1 hypothetical protein LP52_01385 [Streptomonospora alba]
MIRGNRAAARSATAAACAAALLAPLGAAAPAAADEQPGQELRPEQWGMEAVGAAEAADADGGGVTVALLDSGVDASHPDLDGGVAEGEDFTEDGGSDPGRTATPLAGIIAGRGHGQEYTGGVVGVAPGADVLSVRVLAGTGEPGEAEEQAVADALGDGIRHAADEGAQVLVLPAGAASADPDEGVQNAVRYAIRNNAVVVAPAGEDGFAYPGAYDGALAVGAVDEDTALTADSPGSGVALVAPGAGIRAPAAGGGYAAVDGTAPAAAFAAGAAALVRAEYPQLRPEEVVDILASAARPTADGEQAAGYGAGMLDVPAAVEEAASAAEGKPLFNEDLADQAAEEDSALPGWAMWAGGVLLAALGCAAGVLLWRRASANPYDLPSREPEPDRSGDPVGAGARSGATRRAGSGHRRGGRRRR